MRIKSTLFATSSKVEDVPVIILALVHTNPHLRGGPHTTTIVDHTFVRLPNTYPALLALARATFQLPPHGALQITTDTLDVCRGTPVRIAEDVYELMRGLLGILRVEVVGEDVDERGKQNNGQREKGNGGSGVGPREMADDKKEEKGEGQGQKEDGLDFVDVFVADGAQQSEQLPGAVSSNSQGTDALLISSTAPKPRAPPSAAAAPASANNSPAPPFLKPHPAVGPSAVGPPEDSHFVIYISGPEIAHEATFVACRTHLVSKVISAACWNSTADTRRSVHLVLKCPDRGPVLCPPDMTIEDCGASRGSHFVVGVAV